MSLSRDALPLLLAGPILRRVESDLVCVWVATSQPCDVSILLFEGPGFIAPETANDDSSAAWVSAPQTTLAIGASLHVVAATLDLRTPGGNALRSKGLLRPNDDYSYDIRLLPRGEAVPKGLRTLELLRDLTPLGYGAHKLPGFRTSPEDRKELVIVHGSCRRMFNEPPLPDENSDDLPFSPPPGDWPPEPPTPESPRLLRDKRVPFPIGEYPTTPKRDGLTWVDLLIDPRQPPARIAGRPHQLFLTGDQIYADDVPAVLLPVLNHVGRVLMGDEELPTDVSGTAHALGDLMTFPPGFRRDIVLRGAGFTTTDGESHLLTFGEFIAYYVLTWSPSLWALDLWPTDFDPSAILIPPDWEANFLYASDADATAESRKMSEEYDELVATLPHPGFETPKETDDPESHAKWFFEQKRDFLALKYWTRELFEWWMRRFKKGLPLVRRALANVPTYMIADDHEITDDWYFSRQWRDRVFTRPLGVATIRHGLMAYSAMQAWGNDPRRWSTGPERELLEQMSIWTTLTPDARRQSADTLPWVQGRLHELLGLPYVRPSTAPPDPALPTFRPLVQYSYQIEGPCHRVVVIDGRTRRRFPSRTAQAGGIDYEGATGLFGDSPMAEALPPPPEGDQKLTLVVAGVPVLGPEGMEAVLLPFQRLARLLLTVDAEAWSYEPGTFEALLWALARYESVVMLSGDIHLACTVVLDYWSAPESQPVRTARIVQLISSGFTQDWGGKTPVLKANALTHDILEQATTAADPSERVGWGTPVRTTLTPPSPLGKLVTLKEGVVAHPTYRSRLKMRAPVVPTVGWPAGSVEGRTPHWAWRMSMVRDERPEWLEPPTTGPAPDAPHGHRWTPVTLAPDPIATESAGWHAQAARRQAYGRTFSFQTNVGIVTFEGSGTAWSVRHVIAGELPPFEGSEEKPVVGLQPFVVHRASLAAPAPANFAVQRPKIRANGGWGADATEPALQLLLHWLPLAWREAAEHADPLWVDLPLNMDAAARDALITKAADRLAGTTFRRRVLRELGPWAAVSDEELDGITEAEIEALKDRIGKFKVLDEARALVRPDLERLMNLDAAAGDPVAFLDDALLIGCSEWVNERCRIVSMIAGLLATFRAPLIKHVPVLSGVLEGVWDRWRNQTGASFWTEGAAPVWLNALASLPPRVVAFVGHLIAEAAFNMIEDSDPRRTGGPPMLPPELVLAGLGGLLSLKAPKRITVASGWQTTLAPEKAGWRRGTVDAETLARQTLSIFLHPETTERFVRPAQRLSVSLVPSGDPDEPGSLIVAADERVQFEALAGRGFRLRIASASKGFIRQPWELRRAPSLGTPDMKISVSVARPTTWSPVDGIAVRITPSIGIAFNISDDPGVELRLALNDEEDRVAFVPEADGFLAQLLPTGGISLPLDAAVTWDIRNGRRFVGLGEIASSMGEPTRQHTPGAKPSESDKEAEVVTPQNKKLGILTLHDRSFGISYRREGDGVTVAAKLSGTLGLNLGPVRIAVSGLGVAANLHVSGNPLENHEPFDFSIDPAIPTGLAISVDTGPVSGGGSLERIVSGTGAVTWRGGVALRIADRFEIAGFGLVETGGGRHWSLLLLLYAKFNPPIPLPAGLKLVKIGGLLGLHRSMNTDALQKAATGTEGTLDSFLPEHPEQRFLELIPAIDRFFPSTPGSHVFGLLAEIEWSVASRKVNGRIRAAVLLQVGNFKAALYGTVQLGFPAIDADHLLRIRASMEALYDHENQFARFSMTIIEAKLFDTVDLTGGMAFLIRWGARREWAFSLGGFHDKFRPFIPAGMREPPRLGAHWHPVDLVDMDLQAYVAVTSTSLQFGASAKLVAGASWGGVRGDIAFDFLIMREPSFHFEASLGFRVTVFLFGVDLLSIGLTGSIEGPGPWIFEATVFWEVGCVEISKDLGPYRWGSEDRTSTISQEVRQLIGDALLDPSNWSIRRSGRLSVRLRSGSEDLLDARDQIEVRQGVLPLGTLLEVHDRNPLSDAGTWKLEPAGGLTWIEDVRDVFPMRRYRRKPPKETPFESGRICGARFGDTGWNARADLAVSSEENASEDLVVDSLPVPLKRMRFGTRVGLDAGMLHASATRSADRRWTRHKPELVRVQS